VLNVSDRSHWYFSGEVQVGVFAAVLCLLGALGLLASFIRAQSAIDSVPQWLVLNFPPALAILLIAVPLGFLYGRLSRNTEVEAELSLAEVYRLLNDISMRQVQSGNPAHVNLIAGLAHETESAKQTATFISDKIWRIQSQLNSSELQQQLAAAIGARHLRAWLSNEKHLTIDHETILEFQIQPFQESKVGASTSGERESTENNFILIQILSNDIEVKNVPVRIALPRVGHSSVGRAAIVPRKQGPCELTFLLIRDGTLELLQTCTTKIEVLSARGA
jgi:hypothetical protein